MHLKPAAYWHQMRIALISLLLLLELGDHYSFAGDVADFYRGRNVDFIVGSGAGGGYDLYARVLARHLADHIPGNPTVVVRNVAGAGGIRATNLMYNVSPRDGSVIGTVSRSMITAPLLGVTSAKFDPDRLTWLGNITGEDSVCVASKTAPAKTWAERLTV